MSPHSLHLPVDSRAVCAFPPIFPESTSCRVSCLHTGHSTMIDVGTVIAGGDCAQPTYYFPLISKGASCPGTTISAHSRIMSMLLRASALLILREGGT